MWCAQSLGRPEGKLWKLSKTESPLNNYIQSKAYISDVSF